MPESSSPWGICLLVFVILFFVIVACWMMYRPVSSEPSSVRKCKLAQDAPVDSVNLRQHDMAPGLPDMSAQRPIAVGPIRTGQTPHSKTTDMSKAII